MGFAPGRRSIARPRNPHVSAAGGDRGLPGLGLAGQVGPGDAEAHLRGAQVDVVEGDFSHQADAGGTQVGQRRGAIGVSRFDGAAQAAEDVELPGGVEAGVVERALAAEGGAAGDATASADTGCTLGCSSVAAGPRGAQGGPGGVEIGVGRQRVGDEGRQLRVGELFPPVGEALR